MRSVRVQGLFCSLLGCCLLIPLGCSQSSQPKSARTQARADRAAASKQSEPRAEVSSADSEAASAPGAGASAPHDSDTSAEEAYDVATSPPALEPAREDSPLPRVKADESRPAKDRAHREEVAQRRRIQSGLLTAGSFDDLEKFDDYKKFLTETLQQDAGERYPRWSGSQRVTVYVHNTQGQPIANAKVEVHAPAEDAQQQTPAEIGELLTTLVTGSDGRAMLLTGEDRIANRPQLAVRVLVPGAAAVDQVLATNDAAWDISVDNAVGGLPQQLDLALVVDTTGSMGDELEYLKVEIDSIAAAVKRMFPNVDQRFALIVYRDAGDEYVSRTFDFTSSLGEFQTTLAAQSANGGGDYPEAMHLALEHAGKLSWRQEKTARVMFLVGDAPPHENHARRTLDAGLALRQLGVRIYPLGASGVAREAEFIMRAMALASMGQYLFLTDHSGIGNAHAAPHVPEFLVERLDRLMIRMIASELAGKRLVPTEVIAIERGAGSNSDSLPPEPQQSQVQVRQTSSVVRSPATNWLASDVTRWLMFGGLILGVFLLDAWEKYRRK